MEEDQVEPEEGSRDTTTTENVLGKLKMGWGSEGLRAFKEALGHGAKLQELLTSAGVCSPQAAALSVHNHMST